MKTTSEFVRDKDGNKVPIIDEKTGEQKVDSRNRKKWKRQNVSANPLDQKETLQELREQWAVECNKYLAEDQQIDHRSYAEQGVDKAPTIHEGYSARGMEQRGEVSERCEMNRAIRSEEKAIASEQDENKAFIEVLKETDNRLQDLQRTGNEQSYNFAYDTVIRTIEQEKRVPVFACQSESVAVFAEDKPSKALSLLQATKEKWNNFIEKCRESVRNAPKNDLSKSEGKTTTTEPKKPHISLLERVRGAYEGIKERRVERTAEKQRAIEQARVERERAEKLARQLLLERPLQSWQYQERAEQLEQLERLWREGPKEPVLQSALVQKVADVTGLKINEYDVKTDSYFKRSMSDIPDKEVFGAISRAKDRVWEDKAYDEERASIKKRLDDKRREMQPKIQEIMKNKEKIKRKERGGHER